uniref:Secreted protein n=1 Tax=Oryza brachyantha TaxID=4533 RepID=J3N4G3_ORYBR
MSRTLSLCLYLLAQLRCAQRGCLLSGRCLHIQTSQPTFLHLSSWTPPGWQFQLNQIDRNLNSSKSKCARIIARCDQTHWKIE